MVIVDVFMEKEVQERMASRVIGPILECVVGGRSGRGLGVVRKVILWCRLIWYLISWMIMRRFSIGLIMLALYVVPCLKVSC